MPMLKTTIAAAVTAATNAETASPVPQGVESSGTRSGYPSGPDDHRTLS